MAGRLRPGQRRPPARASAPLALPGDLADGPAARTELTTKLRLAELSLEGVSRAGDATWFRVHPPGLAFDTGRGDAVLGGAADVFLTHGHLDHALGLPFVVSLRTLAGESTRVFCPRAIAADVEALLAAAARLEGAQYRYQLQGLDTGERVSVGKDLTVEAFAVDHRVPSLGYHLLRARHRLRADLAHHDGAVLAARRAAGEVIDEAWEEIWLSYPGDTGAGVFELEPRLYESRVLMLECTFLGDAHRERAARYGHLHLEDLRRLAGRSRNEAIVLYHASRRYRAVEWQREIERALPEIAGRVRLFGLEP